MPFHIPTTSEMIEGAAVPQSASESAASRCTRRAGRCIFSRPWQPVGSTSSCPVLL